MTIILSMTKAFMANIDQELALLSNRTMMVNFVHFSLKVVRRTSCYPEVIAYKIWFGGLSPKILFYKKALKF